MRTNTKVKVKVNLLLDAVEKKRAELVKKHEVEKATYSDRLKNHNQEVVKFLRSTADKVEKTGKLPKEDYGGRIYVEIPRKPSEPTLNTSKIDRTIATLKIAADDAIAISADDYAEYLG